MSDGFNMSMRKFLKQVGVTSQQEIEALVRSGAVKGDTLTVTVTLSAEGSDLNHVVTGKIDLSDANE